MAELTGLFGIDWAVVFFFLFGATLVAMSRRRDIEGFRVVGFLVIPVLAGTLLLVEFSIRYNSFVRRFFPFLRRPVTVTLVVAVAFVAVAVADLLLTRLARLPGQLWRRPSRARLGDAGLALFIGGPAIAALVTMTVLTNSIFIQPAATGLALGLRIETVRALPGPPFGIALRGPRDGYISLGKQIVRFQVSSQDTVTFTTVAEGFAYARGLTVVGNELVVADLGQLPCSDPFPYCKGGGVPGVNYAEGARRILEQSRGRLYAFDIEQDGSLTNRRIILDDLPVNDNEHGVNGVVTGPDGFVYVAIGGLDEVPPSVAKTIKRPNADLMGTILRLSPDGHDVQVFARGLRNVYGLTFDNRGGLWGVDNDGVTVKGWRAEEVLHIRRGKNYGYPLDGSSFGPHGIRNDFSIWNVEGPGSAGVLWAGDAGLGPGLLIGSCGHIDGLRLTDFGGEWGVASPADYARLLNLPGCVDDIKAIGPHTLLVSVFGLLRTDALYVLKAGN